MKIPPEKIENLVGNLAGKDVIPLVQILMKRKNVSEFKLAERMKLGINQVRNMLYRMNEFNLVSSTRKKDKKKGWYIYYWTFNESEATQLLLINTEKNLEYLKSTFEREQVEQFYISKAAKLRFNAATALELDFRCPETNTLLEPEDKEKVLRSLTREISKVEVDLKELKELVQAMSRPPPAPKKKAAKKAVKKKSTKKKAAKKSSKKTPSKKVAKKKSSKGASKKKAAKKSSKKKSKK